MGRPQSGGQPQRLGARERQRSEHHVAQRLGEHAAEAEQHAGAEARVAHQPGDQLAPPAHHLGHQQPDRPIFRPRLREELRRRGAHRGRTRQAEPHQVALGLVGDPLAAQLESHRPSELLGGLLGLRRIGHQALARKRHAVAREQLLGGRFGQGASGGARRGGVSCGHRGGLC
jgi:hypothetical protein